MNVIGLFPTPNLMQKYNDQIWVQSLFGGKAFIQIA